MYLNKCPNMCNRQFEHMMMMMMMMMMKKCIYLTLAAKPRDVFSQKPALPHRYLCRDIITNKAAVHNTILIQRTQLPKKSKYRRPKITLHGLTASSFPPNEARIKLQF